MATRERQRTGGEWRVRVGAEETSAIYDPAVGAEGVIFVFAHGAGGNMNDRAVVATSRALNERGIGTVRFNFLYREKKSGRPDPMPKLRDAFKAVVDRARAEIATRTLLIGGRSMGGRAASMLASDGFDAAGLVLLAYPLHPPGKTDQLRDAHLPSIRMPVICFNGTRDPFCTPSLMEEVLKRVTTNWEMHWVEGADHSFHVLKSSGKTDTQVLDQMSDTIRDWVERLERRPTDDR